jgi:hypothetical protein
LTDARILGAEWAEDGVNRLEKDSMHSLSLRGASLGQAQIVISIDVYILKVFLAVAGRPGRA